MASPLSGATDGKHMVRKLRIQRRFWPPAEGEGWGGVGDGAGLKAGSSPLTISRSTSLAMVSMDTAQWPL